MVQPHRVLLCGRRIGGGFWERLALALVGLGLWRRRLFRAVPVGLFRRGPPRPVPRGGTGAVPPDRRRRRLRRLPRASPGDRRRQRGWDIRRSTRLRHPVCLDPSRLLLIVLGRRSLGWRGPRGAGSVLLLLRRDCRAVDPRRRSTTIARPGWWVKISVTRRRRGSSPGCASPGT